MSNTFKKSLAALLLVLVLAVVAAFTLNLGFLRGFLEQRLSESTGLTVEISGPLDIRLGSELKVSASQVRASNPGWQGDQQVALVEGLVVQARLKELLSDTVRVRSVRIESLDLDLARDEQMRGNWQALPSTEKPSSSAPLLVDSLHVDSGSGSFYSPQLDAPLAWEIGRLEHEVSEGGSVLTSFDGTLGKKPFKLELSGGPWASVVGKGNAAFELSATLGEVRLQGQAAFDQLWAPHRPQMSFSLNGPDFQDLASTLGIHGLGAGPLDLTINSAEEEDRLRIDAAGSLGQLRLDGAAFVDSLSQVRVATIDGQVSGPNFGRLMRLAGYPDWPESRFEATLNSELAYPRLDVRQLDLSVAGADISLQGTVPALPALSGAELSLSATGTALQPFARAFAIDDAPDGPFSVSGSVSSADDSTNVDLEYQTTLANGSVTGTIGNGAALEGTQLAISAGRDSAATLGKALGIEGLPAAPWKFDTTVSFPDNRVYRLKQVRFETKGITATLSGDLGRETLRRDSDVQFEIEGARLADFQSLVGATPRLPGQAFGASGRVTSDPKGWLIEQLEATVGDDRFQINGTLGSTAGLAGTRLAIGASGQNAGRFLPADQAWRLPDGPYRLNTSVEVQEGRIILSDSAFNSGPVSAKGSADIPWPLNGDSGAFNLAVDSRDITALISRIGGLELDPNPLEIRATGQWRDGRIQLDVAEAKAGLSALSLTGTLDLPPNLSKTNLSVSAASPDLSTLGTFSGERWQPVSLDLTSAFTGTQTQFTMSRFDMRLGDSVMNGDLTIDFESAVPAFDLQLASDRLDLRPFITNVAEPADASQGSDSDNMVIPDTGFPFEALAMAQGQLEVRAGQLQLENITLRDTVLRGSVRNGALDLSELSTAGYRGRLTAALKLEPLATGEGRLTASLQSNDLVFNLANQPSEEKDQLPAFDIDISMSGKGGGLRQSAASMNGKIRIGSEGGRVPNIKARSASGLFLSEILSTISPSVARQDHIQISCFATSADIADGIVALEPGVAVQSEKLNVFMVGKINLANETLDARLRTETRKTIDLSASELVSPYVKLSGTLSNPSLRIDPKGTLLSGGAAYLSGGLSILAKKALDQLGGTSNPCDGYLEEKQAGKTP